MYIDWITWSIWTFGLALLLYWFFETIREFKQLFAKRRSRNPVNPGGNVKVAMDRTDG